MPNGAGSILPMAGSLQAITRQRCLNKKEGKKKHRDCFFFTSLYDKDAFGGGRVGVRRKTQNHCEPLLQRCFEKKRKDEVSTTGDKRCSLVLSFLCLWHRDASK